MSKKHRKEILKLKLGEEYTFSNMINGATSYQTYTKVINGYLYTHWCDMTNHFASIFIPFKNDLIQGEEKLKKLLED